MVHALKINRLCQAFKDHSNLSFLPCVANTGGPISNAGENTACSKVVAGCLVPCTEVVVTRLLGTRLLQVPCNKVRLVYATRLLQSF